LSKWSNTQQLMFNSRKQYWNWEGLLNNWKVGILKIIIATLQTDSSGGKNHTPWILSFSCSQYFYPNSTDKKLPKIVEKNFQLFGVYAAVVITATTFKGHTKS
jgi:hypothetical protein